MDSTKPRCLNAWSLDRVDYADGLRLQETLVELRRADSIPDTLILLEHPPVLTLGRGAEKSNIVASPTFLEAAGIEVFETGRGGDVTFHGPGQLVGYPIINLNPDRRDVRRYMRDLEEVLIRTLADFDLAARRIDGLTGVWIGNRKIAAMGVRISRWITSHGFALNIRTQLDYFNLIVPCGIRDKGVTSLDEELGRDIDPAEVETRLLKHFADVFDREVIPQHIQHHSVQVVVVHRNKGKTEYLLLHRIPSRGDFWQPVTGSIKRKRNETPIEAARRELTEETGFEAEVVDLDYVHGFMIDPRYQKSGMKSPIFNREHSFAALVPNGNVVISAKEHDDHVWLDFAAARERLLWNGNRRAFDLTRKLFE